MSPRRSRTTERSPDEPAQTVDLGAFEGRDVLRATIKMTKAGDGLSQSMSIAPQVLHTGEEVFVLMRCEVGPIRFPPIKDTDALEREQTLIAKTALIVDADYARAPVQWAQDRLERHRASMAGQRALADEPHEFHEDPDDEDTCADCGKPKGDEIHTDPDEE